MVTPSRGLMDKSPNTPYDTLKIIEKELAKRLTKQEDGRWRYPDKENDMTLAVEIGKGATHSAVRRMRIEKHPGELVPQQLTPRAKKQFVMPNAGEPIEADPVSAMLVRIHTENMALTEEMDTLKQRLKFLEDVVGAYTRPRQAAE